MNPFDNPLLHQYLSSSQDAAVVFIGPKPPSHTERESARQLHACSLEELSASMLSHSSAQLATTDITESVADGSRAAGSADRSFTAVLQLESAGPAVDSLLGRAVRMFPYRLLVCCPDQAVADNHFFAFGFRRLDALCTPLTDCEEPRWYEYRMSDYKSPPDWLNARFWANPDRFDLPEEPDLYCDEEE